MKGCETMNAYEEYMQAIVMRAYFEDIPPSSPSIAILRDGQLEYFIPREQIEGFSVEQIRDHITGVLKQACGK